MRRCPIRPGKVGGRKRIGSPRGIGLAQPCAVALREAFRVRQYKVSAREGIQDPRVHCVDVRTFGESMECPTSPFCDVRHELDVDFGVGFRTLIDTSCYCSTM